MVGVIALNRNLLDAWDDINDARSKEDWNRHLRPSSRGYQQPLNASCPSEPMFGIQCPCAESGIAARLRPRRGATLIVIPPSIVANWAAEAQEHLNDRRNPWLLRHAYHDYKTSNIIPKIDGKNDRPYLELRLSNEDGSIDYHPKAASMVVITSIKCHPSHLVQPFDIWFQPLRKSNRGRLPQLQKRVMQFAWGPMYCDEAHLEHERGTLTISLFRGIQGPAKWMLTGTPFEQSPARMAAWIETFEDTELWKGIKRPPKSLPWERADTYRANLKFCTHADLQEQGKIHEKLVRNTYPPVERRERLREYCKQMACILNTLWLRRHSTDSKFFGQPLTTVPPNVHHKVECSLPDDVKKTVNDDAVRIAALGSQPKCVKNTNKLSSIGAPIGAEWATNRF